MFIQFCFFLINCLKIYRVGHDRATKHIKKNEVKVKVAQSCRILWDTIDLHSPWNSSTGVGSLSLLQGIFLTQGLNPGLLHCRRILYRLSQQGSPLLARRTSQRSSNHPWVHRQFCYLLRSLRVSCFSALLKSQCICGMWEFRGFPGRF